MNVMPRSKRWVSPLKFGSILRHRSIDDHKTLSLQHLTSSFSRHRSSHWRPKLFAYAFDGNDSNSTLHFNSYSIAKDDSSNRNLTTSHENNFTDENQLSGLEQQHISTKLKSSNDDLGEGEPNESAVGGLGDIMSSSDSKSSYTLRENQSDPVIDPDLANMYKDEKGDELKSGNYKSNQESTLKIIDQSGKATPSSTENKFLQAVSSAPPKSGLVTGEGRTLQSRFCSKIMNIPLSPLDRIALTANGNLQRIFSSFYDSPVHVHLIYCNKRSPEQSADNNKQFMSGKHESFSLHEKENGCEVWNRCVDLTVHSKRFCTAVSKVTVVDQECIRLVGCGAVGIGQLFRYLNILPTFELIDAGRTKNGELWREYVLRSNELCCEIREEFALDAWSITPLGNDN
eukprot:CAMPEP_0194439144 /NCGR_PEP_ID=MMETSP0176-20130528/108842_1 /TAXON_ID=216777 /ORGANISM="Proboscia alata, Strain PI-D3" /LENGTH=399 /DNA_ID=CAMNT_0039262049 /DNA_START=237 /DNA_END=1436 /DNA_ORIENTATION=-